MKGDVADHEGEEQVQLRVRPPSGLVMSITGCRLWVHAFALIALEGGAIVDEFYSGLAVWTGQDFEQFGVNRHASSVIRRTITS